MLLFTWRSPLKRARRAARSGRWCEAASAYRDYLDADPSDDDAWIQLGHSLKENGEVRKAVDAYRKATQIAPDKVEGWIHLAHIERRIGHREEAIKALEQALCLECTGDHATASRAVRDLVEMGARERLPLTLQAQIEKSEGCYARSRYPEFREARSQPENASALERSQEVLAVIDARDVGPDLVAITCESLDGHACLILSDDAVAAEALIGITARYLLLVDAGATVASGAIERLCKASEETGAVAAYCDHDHWEIADFDSRTSFSPNGKIIRCDPCFQPMFDPIWFRRREVQPPCILVETAAIGSVKNWNELFSQRLSLAGGYAHVPIVLASCQRGRRAASASVCTPAIPCVGEPGSIQVIIQTRDAPDMLEQCVASLLRTAANPSLLDILIVDNRSVLDRTADLLAKWRQNGVARIMSHDEPFNWARANNLAVERGEATYLLFLNNDVEMDSVRWDDVLRRELALDEIGAMGALLLYPDRLIQHAGVVFGMGTGGAVHEGVGQSLEEGGPAERWRQPRLASAVTGAWLATTRALFEVVGGFEERLPVAYNDIDFSLRCRAAHRLVIQTSEIVAVHRESATRGSVMSRSEHVRDQADWAWLRTRWGDGLTRDPGFNPNWARTGQPFDGICIPSEETLARWIVDSAHERPWSVSAASPP